MTGKVLVVDDVEQNVKLLEAKLSSEYYSVFSAYSGIECLRVVKDISPDIILLDVMMPEMDGFETCKHLKADPETAHIPVVMVTALSEVEDRVEGLTSGAADFITKPIDELHLFARVKSLVRLKVAMDEARMRDKTGNEFGLTVAKVPQYNDKVTGNILLIDDDIVQRKKITKILVGSDYKVSEAYPADVSEILAERSFDLIIISTLLDDVDGLRLAVEIRSEKEENRHIPIMILIDEDDHRLLITSLEVGIDDYVMIPLEPNELKARVRTQLVRKNYQDFLKSSYQENVSAAVIDSLTQLYNRRYLDAHLHNIADEAKKTGAPLSLMTIDIDHFKAVNDRPGWGHDVGDEVLVEVAKRIMNSIRSNYLATRPGGEEFVIIMPSTNIMDAEKIAERTRINMESKSFKISADPYEADITISIGVASLNEGENALDLIKHSDEALFDAKNRGRNQVVVYEQNKSW